MNHVRAIVNTERYSSSYNTVLATTVLFPVGPALTQMSHIFGMLAQIMVGLLKLPPTAC